MPSPTTDPSVVAQQNQAAIKNQQAVQQNVSIDTANLLKMFGGKSQGGLTSATASTGASAAAPTTQTLVGQQLAPSALAQSLLNISGPFAQAAQGSFR